MRGILTALSASKSTRAPRWERWFPRHPRMRNARPATLPARLGLEEAYSRVRVSKTTLGSGAGSCRAARWLSATPKVAPMRLSAWMWLPPTTKVEDALRALRSQIVHHLPHPCRPAGIASAVNDGRLLETNPALCALLGLLRHQVLGRTSQELNLATLHEHTRLLHAKLRNGRHQLPCVVAGWELRPYPTGKRKLFVFRHDGSRTQSLLARLCTSTGKKALCLSSTT